MANGTTNKKNNPKRVGGNQRVEAGSPSERPACRHPLVDRRTVAGRDTEWCEACNDFVSTTSTTSTT